MINSIEDLLGKFQSKVKKEVSKSRSPNTVRAYTSDIESILDKTKFSPDTILETLEDYQDLVEDIDNRVKLIINQSDYQQSTKNRKIFAVKSFLALLNLISGVQVPTYKDKTRYVKQALLTTLTNEQFDKLMEYIPLDRTFMNARDRVVFGLIYYRGIDPGEIVIVEYVDFNREDGKVTCLKKVGRGDKMRYITLTERISKDLKKYETLYKASGKKPPLNSKGIPYFRNKHGDPISTRSIRRNLKKYAKKAGFEDFEDINPMCLRHSYIEGQLIAGVKPATLAESVGVSPVGIYNIKRYLPNLIPQKNK